MKTLAKGVVALALVLVGPVVAMASPTNTIPGCNIPPDHGISNQDGTMWTGCITAAAWDAAMAAQQHGVALPVFVYPATVTDKYGITYDCAIWMPHGCVDATKTPEYAAYMQSLGAQIYATGGKYGDYGGRFDGLLMALGYYR